MKLVYSLIFLAFSTHIFAQVEIDKPIQLTGSGSDAKLTGIQNVSSPQDAVSAEVEQNNTLTYAQATNSGDAFTIVLTPAPSSYNTGMVVHFRSSANISGATTLNVNALGPITIKKNFNADLAANDIKSGQMVSVMYDGTNFQMLSQIANAPSGGLTAENSNNTSTWTSPNSTTDWEDITSHSHTVTQSGRYLVMASFESIDGGGGTNQLIRVNANGKTSSSVSVGTYLSAFQSFSLSMLVDLNSGNVVKLQNQNNWNYGYKNQVKNIVFSLIRVQ